MTIERRFDGDTWAWCIITSKGEVLHEFASHDDAAAWLQQNARAPRDKARKIDGNGRGNDGGVRRTLTAERRRS